MFATNHRTVIMTIGVASLNFLASCCKTGNGESGNPGIWESGNLGIRESGNPGVGESGNLGIGELSN